MYTKISNEVIMTSHLKTIVVESLFLSQKTAQDPIYLEFAENLQA